MGTTGTDVTDGTGTATFSYVGTAVGTDTIEATFVDGLGNTQRSNRVEKHWVDAPATPTPVPPTPTEGRMTGGGSVPMAFSSIINVDAKKGGGKPDVPPKASHGFTIQSDLDSEKPNNIAVNWGNGNKFHLKGKTLTSAACSDDPDIDEANPVAGFDTFIGSGTGRYNGVSGATIEFTFTYAVESGTDDEATILIKDAGGATLPDISSNRDKGNHQAHP